MPRELQRRKREPWYRRSDESHAAWECFRAYLSQEAPRSVPRVAPPREHPQATPEAIAHWAIVHEWDARADAYDLISRRSEHAAMRGSAQLMAVRNLQAINAGFEFIFRELSKWNAISQESPTPVIQAAQVVPLLRGLIEMRRLASGESTANVAVAMRGVPHIPEEIAKLSPAELLILDQLQRKVT